MCMRLTCVYACVSPNDASPHAGAWLQMSTNWVCSLLYFWTLMAVKACPNRDFS